MTKYINIENINILNMYLKGYKKYNTYNYRYNPMGTYFNVQGKIYGSACEQQSSFTENAYSIGYDVLRQNYKLK